MLWLFLNAPLSEVTCEKKRKKLLVTQCDILLHDTYSYDSAAHAHILFDFISYRIKGCFDALDKKYVGRF